MTHKNNYNIKTLIFDLGGVYFTRGSYLAMEKIIDIYDIKQENLIREFFKDSYKKEGHLLRLGLITMDEFEKRLISTFNINVNKIDHIRNIWFGSYVPHYNMRKLILDLKRYRLIIFSGNIKERIEFLNQRYDFLKLFDDSLFSYEYQKNKDNIEFYHILLKHLQCEPSEAILIDDEKKNIRIAESIGIHGILYYYTEHLIEELKKYNISIHI